jgi:hypothetical protein
MSDSIAELFKNKQYCFDEINRIRQTIGNKTLATEAAFAASFRTLSFMLLHCPEEIYDLVVGQIKELQRRERYALFGI